MIKPIPPFEFLSANVPLIDVRSPGEFAQGHIPGAINMPLFTDEERVRVGTLYKEKGHDAAVLEGLRSVGPKLALLAEAAQEIAPEKRIGVHCWRGGERSASTAWLLAKAGFKEVLLLKGGYKAYRRHVLECFEERWDMRILGGFTGTGKTELLGEIRALGQATIDLERLANHKGSSFGAIGEAPQPTTEHFENLLCNELRTIGSSTPFWLEDESQMIGRVKIPDPFYHQMRNAHCFFVEMPKEERAARLVLDYGKFPKSQLAEATLRIAKRIGPQHCKTAIAALEVGDLHKVANIALSYYDKTYLHGLSKRDPSRIFRATVNGGDLRTMAARAISFDK